MEYLGHPAISCRRIPAGSPRYTHSSGKTARRAACCPCWKPILRAKGAVPALESAFCLGDAAAARQAAWRLVGRGRGLTPSGDDFLCGFFQTLYAARAAGLPVPEIADTCAAELSGALNRTSRISGAYLRHALLGSYFTIYDASARTVLGGAGFSDSLQLCIRHGRFLRHRHTARRALGRACSFRIPPKPYGYTS